MAGVMFGFALRRHLPVAGALTLLAIPGLIFGQYKTYEWAHYDNNELPANRILFGGAPAETVGVQDLTAVTPPPAGLLQTYSETGKYAMVMRSRPKDGKLWATAMAFGQVLDRDRLGPNTRALFQADFFIPADGSIPNLAVLAIEPPPDAVPGSPTARGASIKRFYRFGIAVNGKLYFSLLNPSAESGKADVFHQDPQLIQRIPRGGWHRFAIVCHGPELIRCYVDGREASFSPVSDKTLRKVLVGVMLADKTNTYDAYADNLSIQISDESPGLPDSPYNSGWMIAAGPSKLAVNSGVETMPAEAVTFVPPAGMSEIPWHQPVEAWTLSQKNGQPMLLYFFAPGLQRNLPLEATFASNPVARGFLQQHICARVDVNQLHGGKVAHQYGVFKVPTIMVIAPDAKTYKKATPAPTDSWDVLQQQLVQ